MSTDNLVAFLYILLRDELPAGKVEAIMRDHVEKGAGRRRVYSNPWLASHAAEIGDRLLRSAPPRGSPRADARRLPITRDQKRFLVRLMDLQRAHSVPPTIREMQAAGGYKSPRSVTQFLAALEHAGYIRRTAGARNIRVLVEKDSQIKVVP